MLPRSARLRRSADFGLVIRSGVRAGSTSVVVHMLRQFQDPPGDARVGFVVSKKVGNSVIRHRVTRRLRHMVRELDRPDGLDVVVRALPAAAIEGDRLRMDLDSAWRRALKKVGAC